MALTGPFLKPLSGSATHLVVLVHGYGADGNDLISLASHWQKLMPHVAFAAPNAPQRVAGAPGYQWFSLSRMDPAEMRRGVETAAPVLEEYLDSQLDRLGLSPQKLALAGFSQGTMLSLHLGPRRKVKPAAIIGFSGLLAAPPPADGAFPPILLTHGDADQVIPAQAMFLAASQLALSGAMVQWHLARGIGHGIDPEGLLLAGEFLNLAFRGLLKSSGEVRCVYKLSSRIS